MILAVFSAFGQLTLPDFGTTGVWNGQATTTSAKYGNPIRKVVDGIYTNMSKLPVYKLNALGSSLLVVNYDPAQVKDSITLVDNQLLLVSLVVDKTTTLTGVKALLKTSNNAIQGATINRVGLYIMTNDTLATLVASSANDTTLWTGTVRSVYSKAFSATYSAAPDVYYVAIVYNYSTTTATAKLYGTNLMDAEIADLDFGANKGRLSCTVATQNDLPATVNMKAATTLRTANRIWAGLY
jgi:hypothetical protein